MGGLAIAVQHGKCYVLPWGKDEGFGRGCLTGFCIGDDGKRNGCSPKVNAGKPRNVVSTVIEKHSLKGRRQYSVVKRNGGFVEFPWKRLHEDSGAVKGSRVRCYSGPTLDGLGSGTEPLIRDERERRLVPCAGTEN